MNSNPIIDVVIVGSGGLGREVLWTLNHQEMIVADSSGQSFQPRVVGFLDDDSSRHASLVNNVAVLGGLDWLVDNRDVLVVLAIGIPDIRQNVVTRLSERGASFATVVSPDSNIGEQSRVGEGSIVLPGAIVTTNVEIGRFTLLNPTVSVSHDCVVGDFCSLGPGVSLAGNVKIGTGCDIGTNASVIPGKRIGTNTIVGAGACVTHDLPDSVTAVGVPAKVLP